MKSIDFISFQRNMEGNDGFSPTRIMRLFYICCIITNISPKESKGITDDEIYKG